MANRSGRLAASSWLSPDHSERNEPKRQQKGRKQKGKARDPQISQISQIPGQVGQTFLPARILK
jgi:hypothetical protein